MTGYSKSEEIEPWVSKSKGKGTKSEPRDTKSEPKGTQREPKGSQKWASGSQKWANGGKSACTFIRFGTIFHQINIKDKVAKSMVFRSSPPLSFGSILGAISIKKRWTNRCENRCRKSNEISWKFDAKMKLILEVFWERCSWKNKIFRTGWNRFNTSGLQ